MIFKFDFEGIIKFSVLTKLSGKLKAFRVLERFACVEIGPDASAEPVWLAVELLRLRVIELLLDNRREGGHALAVC